MTIPRGNDLDPACEPGIVDAMCRRPLHGLGITQLVLDTTPVVCSRGGAEVEKVLVIAIGKADDGIVAVVGIGYGRSDDQEFWVNFFFNLRQRGLSGLLQIESSDTHRGLVRAASTVYPRATVTETTGVSR